MSLPLKIRRLGRQPYAATWRAMSAFTDNRTADTPDELWLLEHDPVFTLGQAGKMEHVLAPGDIPVMPVDRGGQVTYHGPGQIVAYPLIDLRRVGVGVRELVHRIEQALIDTLAHWNMHGGAARGRAGRLRGRRQGRRARLARAPRLQLPRAGLQCGHGPGAVPPHQSLRLQGFGGHAAARLGRSVALATVEDVLVQEFCRQFGFVAEPAAPVLPELPARAAV